MIGAPKFQIRIGASDAIRRLVLKHATLPTL